MTDDDTPGPIKFIQIRPTSIAASSNYPFDVGKYVRERLEGEPADAGIPALAWFDHLFEIDSELKQHGIETQLFAGVLDLNVQPSSPK